MELQTPSFLYLSVPYRNNTECIFSPLVGFPQSDFLKYWSVSWLLAGLLV